jgi:hypothetical protein
MRLVLLILLLPMSAAADPVRLVCEARSLNDNELVVNYDIPFVIDIAASGETLTAGFEGNQTPTPGQQIEPYVYSMKMKGEIRTLTLAENRGRFVMTAVDLKSMIWMAFDGPCEESR